MKVKANHLTAARVILLPLPYVLLYGDTNSRIAALVILCLLGITDYLDGLLARRDGATALGAMLDPLADKIFTAVMLLPLLDLDILPLWIVWPIFLREFLVTELRYVLKKAGIDLKVTELAKIKTTLQMTGAGLILITDTFPDIMVPVAFISGALIATTFLAIGLYIRDGQLSTRIKTALSLLTAALVIRLMTDVHTCILVYGSVIMAITLASGTQYVLKGLPECIRKGPFAILRVFASITIPLLAASLVAVAPERNITVLVLAIICLEFTAQGLDMWATQKGKRDLSKWRTIFILPVCLGTLLAFWILRGPLDAVYMFLMAAIVMDSLYLGAQAAMTIKGSTV